MRTPYLITLSVWRHFLRRKVLPLVIRPPGQRLWHRSINWSVTQPYAVKSSTYDTHMLLDKTDTTAGEMFRDCRLDTWHPLHYFPVHSDLQRPGGALHPTFPHTPTPDGPAAPSTFPSTPSPCVRSRVRASCHWAHSSSRSRSPCSWSATPRRCRCRRRRRRRPAGDCGAGGCSSGRRARYRGRGTGPRPAQPAAVAWPLATPGGDAAALAATSRLTTASTPRNPPIQQLLLFIYRYRWNKLYAGKIVFDIEKTLSRLLRP